MKFSDTGRNVTSLQSKFQFWFIYLQYDMMLLDIKLYSLCFALLGPLADIPFESEAGVSQR